MKYIPHDRDVEIRGPNSRISTGLSGSRFPRRQQRGQAPNDLPHPEELLALAGKLIEARDIRSGCLPSSIFGEPGWDMLLALYRADGAGYRMTVSHMCRASQAPATTALRWIDNLIQLNMVLRRENPLDGRVVFIEMTPQTRRAIEHYLMEVWVRFYSSD